MVSALEVCTLNSITGGVLTWSVGMVQTLDGRAIAVNLGKPELRAREVDSPPLFQAVRSKLYPAVPAGSEKNNYLTTRAQRK